MEDKYTSKEFSKKLKEAGCEINSDTQWTNWLFVYPSFSLATRSLIGYKTEGFRLEKGRCVGDYYHAYDIEKDICEKHMHLFFSEDNYTKDFENISKIRSEHIKKLMQQGEKQKAEDYIWHHCLFNPANK